MVMSLRLDKKDLDVLDSKCGRLGIDRSAFIKMIIREGEVRVSLQTNTGGEEGERQTVDKVHSKGVLQTTTKPDKGEVVGKDKGVLQSNTRSRLQSNTPVLGPQDMKVLRNGTKMPSNYLNLGDNE